MNENLLLLMADVILVAHFALALFITYSLPVIWIGRLFRWRFVHNPWFRYTHLCLMGVVLLESLVGKLCPLTVWETALRRAAGTGGEGGQSFVAHWVGRLLFHDFEEWFFTVAYAAFFAAVMITFFLVPVRRQGKNRKETPDHSTE